MKGTAMLMALAIPALMSGQPGSDDAKRATKQPVAVAPPTHQAISSPAYAGHPAPPPLGNRKLVPEKQVIDLGDIKSSEPQKVSVLMKNTDTKPLQVVGVLPSCGCTTVDPTQANKTVAPGETHRIDLMLNPSGFNGPVVKTVSIQTNEAAEPIQVQIHANVKALAFVQPAYLVLDAYENGAAVTTPFRLVPATKGLDPASFEPEDKALGLKVVFEKAIGGEVKGTVTLDPKTYKAPLTLGQRRTVIRYIDKSGEVEAMNVIWSVRPYFWSSPGELDVKTTAGAPVGPVSQFFVVSDRVVKVTEVKLPTRGLTIRQIPPFPSDPKTILRFAVDGVLPHGLFKGEIRISTDHPVKPAFTIPYVFDIK